MIKKKVLVMMLVVTSLISMGGIVAYSKTNGELKNINTLEIVSIDGGFSESEIAEMEKNYQNTIEISNQRDKQIGDIIFRITNDDNLRMKAIELDK
ncbi:hypothetical protein M4I33_06210 [Clostridium sp. LY3-2]|uniref:hypothetical protein n=1 Tax=Clostridium sp. LY3-2 TaxID=2942482 RepID=UPI002153463C|nr:hypothetical protein [Clostridium sp. LY3-2]MCR6514473.1 hypothetical protein [Clostridium sp. LY3-2]